MLALGRQEARADQFALAQVPATATSPRIRSCRLSRHLANPVARQAACRPGQRCSQVPNIIAGVKMDAFFEDHDDLLLRFA